ncbi:DUF5004 domain-containing protein [Tannerella sp.]|uniref:DUF5004 domain-containing protein n=1 Tax=Tannerella sp. TaxID=2382127 RepID=UPI0026DD0E00|nr:DUF5004 domain-containing protein [Tannerella sp.]MDO4704332.1 DUF5004 domain-containing protein [Tannerella sp.]
MKQKIILWIGALFLLMVGAGCEKEELKVEDFTHLKCPLVPTIGAKGDIIGTWKLIQTISVVGTKENVAVFDTMDVSCKNVYYEFKKDKTLRVTGNVGNIPSGTYEYLYVEFNTCPLCLPAPNLSINKFDTTYYCIVEPYKMSIDKTIFMRIK